MAEQGSRPVVFLSLKDIKQSDIDSMLAMFASIMQTLYDSFSYLQEADDEVRVCPVCHGNQADVIFHRDFSRQQELVPFPAYDVVLCHDCGMGYARPSAVDNLERYYAENSKYESMEAS